MSFDPAHDAVVMYATDPDPIVDYSDGVTPSSLPPVPASPVVLGYTNLPQAARGLSNSKGFAVGQQGAAYNRRGARNPSFNVTIRPGSVASLPYLFPDANGKLPYLALFFLVRGQYTRVFRKCKPATIDFNLFGASGEGGGEISIGANFLATAMQEIAPLVAPPALLRALGTPLMYHDTRKFLITDHAGTATSYRRALMNLTAKVDYKTERKNERPDFGDNNPLSMTSYDLLEHHQEVDGSIGLHQKLPSALFDGALRAQDWGDIIVRCADVEAAKGFDFNIRGVFPSDETNQGAESSAEIDYTVPFTADSLALSLI